jgi:hypothetical protein
MKAKSYLKSTTFLSGICAVGLFAGCATRSPNAQAGQSPLRIGMSKGEVRQVMGSPKETCATSQDESWRYNDHVKALIPLYSLVGGEFSDTVVKFDADGKVKNWWIVTRTSSLASGNMQLSPF